MEQFDYDNFFTQVTEFDALFAQETAFRMVIDILTGRIEVSPKTALSEILGAVYHKGFLDGQEQFKEDYKKSLNI